MNIIAMTVPKDGSRPLKTVPIMTGQKTKHDVTYRITKPYSHDIREVPAGEPIDWEEIYR